MGRLQAANITCKLPYMTGEGGTGNEIPQLYKPIEFASLMIILQRCIVRRDLCCHVHAT